MNFVHLFMPRKKADTIIDKSNDKEQVRLEQIPQNPQKSVGATPDSAINRDMEKKASELSSKIVRELYRHYGIKDSHTNKHLYQHVMFEVARLSNKTIDEVLQKWPKFEIFSILDNVKKVVAEELEKDPTIMYQMVMNGKIIADRILAKVITNSIT